MWGTPKSSPLAPIPTGGVSSPYSTVEVVPPSRHRSDSPPPCLPRAETHHSRCLPRVQAPLATSAAGYRFTSTAVPQETPATAPEQLPAPRPGLSLDSSRSVVIATPGPPPSGAHQAQATPVPSPRSGGPPSSRPRVKSAGRVGSRAPPLAAPAHAPLPLPCRRGLPALRASPWPPRAPSRTAVDRLAWKVEEGERIGRISWERRDEEIDMTHCQVG